METWDLSLILLYGTPAEDLDRECDRCEPAERRNTVAETVALPAKQPQTPNPPQNRLLPGSGD